MRARRDLDAPKSSANAIEAKPDDVRRAAAFFNRHSVVEYKVKVGDRYITGRDIIAPEEPPSDF